MFVAVIPCVRFDYGCSIIFVLPTHAGILQVFQVVSLADISPVEAGYFVMNNLAFNQEIAIALYESDNDFPVDLDFAFQWLGYSSKQKAKDKLVRNFEKDIDFVLFNQMVECADSKGSSRREKIYLTIDCLKSIGMMSGTEQGKLIRKYFLECERIAKASTRQFQKLGAYTQRVEAMFDDANKIPAGYWCVLHESANLLIWVETKLKYPVDKADLLDGSIGIHWSNHRKDKDWAGDRIKFKYRFPDGRYCNPWCYQMKELEQFRYFLEDKYRPVLLPQYLESKYPALVKV